MIRRHVLSALAAGVVAGDDDAAREALGQTEWILRGAARRRLERSLIDAALATNELGGGDPEAARYVQRVAALQVARVAVDVHDREHVTSAYAALPASGVPRFPIVMIAAGLLCVAAVAGIWVMRPNRDVEARRAPRVAEGYVRPLPPPVSGAFRDGGVPLRDEAIEKLLEDDLTTFVLEVDADRKSGGMRSGRKARAAALEHAAPIVARGPALVAAWTDMLSALDRWVYVPAAGRAFKDVVRELRAKVRVVSDELAAAGVGIYLEGDVMSIGDTAHALVYSYRVEQVVFVVAGRAPRRVLSLRRLDHLNLSHALLGMQSEELGDPVVLLDQIDEHVTTTVLPVLAPHAAYPLGDDEWQTGETGLVSIAAGEAIRRELAVVLGDDAAIASEVATLVAERAKLVDAWRAQLEHNHLRMSRTDKLFLPAGLLDKLDGHVPAAERARVAEIERQLAGLDASRIAARCHDAVAATVRRHEAQHGVDDDRPEPLRYPGALEDHLGPALDDDGDPRRSVERSRAELSAYVSQIANDPVTPQLSLWHVARNVFHPRRWGTAESYAGVLIVEGLGRHLGVAATGPAIHDGKIDRARLAQAAAALVVASDDQLRAAARALWLELYGEPLVPIVDQ